METRARRAEREGARWQRRAEALAAENKALRAQVQEERRAARRQAGPFRRRRRKEERSKAGRKVGHAAAHRAAPERIDRDIHVPLSGCPCCGGDVVDVKNLAPQVVVDLPQKVALEATRFHSQSGWCGGCHKRVRSRHAEQMSTANGAAGIQIGPRAWSLAVDIKQRIGPAYRKVVSIFMLAFGFSISAGALVRAEKRIAARCMPTYAALVAMVRKSKVVHADETGWYVVDAVAKPWLWVFASAEPRITVYAIRLSRGSDVVNEILGAAFHGVLCIDGWAGYIQIACRKGQCSAHLLRRCAELLEVQKRGAARFAHAVQRLLLAGICLKSFEMTMPSHNYAYWCGEIRDRMARLLRGNILDADNARFARHLLRHEDEIFTYLEVPALEPTNNIGEREIRPAVIMRKISCGNRSLVGAHVHEILATVSRTSERNGHTLPALLPAVLCSADTRTTLPVVEGMPPTFDLPKEEPRAEDQAHREDDRRPRCHRRRGRKHGGGRARSGGRRTVHRDRGDAEPPPSGTPRPIRGDAQRDRDARRTGRRIPDGSAPPGGRPPRGGRDPPRREGAQAAHAAARRPTRSRR